MGQVIKLNNKGLVLAAETLCIDILQQLIQSQQTGHHLAVLLECFYVPAYCSLIIVH